MQFFSSPLGRDELALNVFVCHQALGDLTGVWCTGDDIYLLFYCSCGCRILMRWPFYRICMRWLLEETSKKLKLRHLLISVTCLIEECLFSLSELA